MSLVLELTGLFLALFFAVFIRYLAFAGGLHFLVTRWKRQAWSWRKISPIDPDPRIVRAEIRWSFIASAIFALAGGAAYLAWQRGWTLVYLDVAEYGWAYFFLSFWILAFLHDTYFYFTHRWMHVPRFYRKIHKVHHDSRHPTAWAAFSFHPIESAIEALILPALVFIIPVHPIVMVAFLTFMTVLSVINHCGFELYPARFANHPLWKWWISATHHQQHHQKVVSNFGLYFTFWDRLLGTHDSEYAAQYERLHARNPKGSVDSRFGSSSPA